MSAELKQRVEAALITAYKKRVRNEYPNATTMPSDEHYRQQAQELMVYLEPLIRDNAQEKAKDGAYYERNQLVAALSKLFPAWREKHPEADKEWEDDWRNIIFIELPTGQASWHIHDSELAYFPHLPQSAHGVCSWDGHTNEEKYKRLAAIALAGDVDTQA